MKIIQIMPEFGLGGAETMCENLTIELTKQGHNVIVLSMYSTQTPITRRLENFGIDLRYLSKKRGFDFSIIKRIKEILIEEKPDVVHAHLYSLKYVVPATRSLKIKTVYTVHSIAQKDGGGKLSRFLNKIFFKRKWVIPVALSEYIKETVVETYKLSPNDVDFVYNGVDLSKCTEKKNYRFGNEIKIVHVGRFFEPKNHIGLVSAFRDVSSLYSECKLYLIGDGAFRVDVEKYVDESGLQDKVIFLGAQSNVFDFLKEMDIFVLPSKYEGIPLSLVEAMGTALPIVATAVGGIPDMVTNEKSALLTNVDDREVSDALIKLIAHEALRFL